MGEGLVVKRLRSVVSQHALPAYRARAALTGGENAEHGADGLDVCAQSSHHLAQTSGRQSPPSTRLNSLYRDCSLMPAANGPLARSGPVLVQPSVAGRPSTAGGNSSAAELVARALADARSNGAPCVVIAPHGAGKSTAIYGACRVYGIPLCATEPGATPRGIAARAAAAASRGAALLVSVPGGERPLDDACAVALERIAGNTLVIIEISADHEIPERLHAVAVVTRLPAFQSVDRRSFLSALAPVACACDSQLERAIELSRGLLPDDLRCAALHSLVHRNVPALETDIQQGIGAATGSIMYGEERDMPTSEAAGESGERLLAALAARRRLRGETSADTSRRTSWSDIGGLASVKRQLRQDVEWPLRCRDALRRLGVRPPRGVLLYGPPGCAKTSLARACCAAMGAAFFSLTIDRVVDAYVGEAERQIRNAFEKARAAAPSVVFIDEVDALAPARAAGSAGGVESRLLSTLLNEMDGVDVGQATNRPDCVDSALLRPGRFDRVLHVPPPDEEARHEILRVHTARMRLGTGVDLEALAAETQGYSGADLAALASAAGTAAVRRAGPKDVGNIEVSVRDFQDAKADVPPSLSGYTQCSLPWATR